MNITGVFNAIIRQYDIIYTGSCAILQLEFKTAVGTVDFSFNLKYLPKMFELLQVKSITQFTKQPCIVYVENGLFRDMGEFLFTYDPAFPIDLEDSWLFATDVVKYFTERYPTEETD